MFPTRGLGLIRQITSVELTRKFQTERFKISLLGEDETTIRLGVKSWWTQLTQFWVCSLFLTIAITSISIDTSPIGSISL